MDAVAAKKALLDRYNEIVARCETDPVFRIVIKSDAE